MNKDLDDRLIPNGEYRNAVNVSINKSQGDGASEGNVGTLQTVLGNEFIVNFLNSPAIDSTKAQGATVIGALPSDVKDEVFVFLTNNNLSQDQAAYIPEGAVGTVDGFPNNQGSSGISGTILSGGAGYSASTGASTTSLTGSGQGLLVTTTVLGGGVINTINLTFASGVPPVDYVVGEILQVDGTFTIPAQIKITAINGPLVITNSGTGYTDGTYETTALTGSGSGLVASIVTAGGSITTVNIESFGGGYADGDTIKVEDPGGLGAVLTINSILPSFSAIVSVNPTTGTANNTNVNSSLRTIAQGAFLNFSTQNPVYGISLIEDLLFFTDNRNQPRKVNVELNDPYYYSKEDQISVAKYYPFESIELYQPSVEQKTLTTVDSATCSAVSSSSTFNLSTTSGGSAPNNLGVVGSFATLANAGNTYATATNVPTLGGTGNGRTVDITAPGAVTAVTINKIGVGYSNGDVLSITGGNGLATINVFVVLPNTFVTNTTNWPNSIVVNQSQTIPVGMIVYFVDPQTTMQDASEEYLPTTATGVVLGAPAPSNTAFSIDIQSYIGTQNVIGHTVFLETGVGTGVFENTGGIISNWTRGGGGLNAIQVVTSTMSDVPVVGEKVILAVPNPYYDSNFENNANIEYLSDKFVRFSYRYKFDDGEYSLIAPFTQPCFIPKQDGYFLSNDDGVLSTNTGGVDDVNTLSDEQKAYRSTEVDFMQNKVNKIILNIPIPYNASSLNTDLKITEIDILYKESDEISIKVVDSIPVSNVVGNGNYYQYEYGSKSPFKTLPEKETTRVSDKVPVKALSQEIASNRIIYGNFQDKHTPPEFLDYTLDTSPKNSFFVSSNEVDSTTSGVEYPNATLKQNRNFEVGVVLSDRFGRQSTPIFSEQTLYSTLGPFLASAIYSPYRGENETLPIGGTKDFDGNSLKIQFNKTIPDVKDFRTGEPGLYNGDATSANYNPLGWYSFKVVVKQTEQDYYNAYIPSAMACYPFDNEFEKELGSTTHIILTNDNINKIPRDLQEVGPTQKDFPSSVRMFGRVFSKNTDNFPDVSTLPDSGNQENFPFFPEKTADISTNVATIKDLFNYENFKQLVVPPPGISADAGYLFYNFDYISDQTPSTPASLPFTAFPDSSSLVARINTQKKFGVQVNPTNAYAGQYKTGLGPALNVYEIAPTVSLLDIYYETSTSGKISDLNKAISEGPPPNIFTQFSNFSWFLKEDLVAGSDVTDDFAPLQLNGTGFTAPSQNTCTFDVNDPFSVVDGTGSTTNDFGTPYVDLTDPNGGPLGIFKIVAGSSAGTFKLKLNLASGSGSPGIVFRAPEGNQGEINPNTLVFKLVCDNPEAGSSATLSINRDIINEQPNSLQVIDKTGQALCSNTAVPVGAPVNVSPLILSQTSPNIVGSIKAANGSSTATNPAGAAPGLTKEDLTFTIESIKFNNNFFNNTQSYTEVLSNNFDQYFTISSPSQNPIGPGAPFDCDLIANPAQQGGLVEPLVSYEVQIKANDPSLYALCPAIFMFRSQGSVSTCPGPGSIIPACKGTPAQTAASHIILSPFPTRESTRFFQQEFFCNLSIGLNPVKLTTTFNGATNGYPDNFNATFLLQQLDSPGGNAITPVAQNSVTQASLTTGAIQWPEVIPANSVFYYKVTMSISITTDIPSENQIPQATLLIGFNDETC